MNKLLVICGPTATGKTSLSLKLAKQFNGEIISADSRQVYQGMDIGTGKEISNIKYQISKTKIKDKKFIIYYLKGIPCWLWDVVKPDQNFSTACYYQLAWLVIEDIWNRRKLPIIVGGTGFYIKAVIDGIETLGIPQDRQLRKKLEKKSLTDLQEELKELNPQRWELMNDSDRQNPRRLIRAIEIVYSKSTSQNLNKSIQENKIHTGLRPWYFVPLCAPPSAETIDSISSSALQPRYSRSWNKSLSVLMIGLTASRQILYQRIDKRVLTRVKQGVVNEVRNLLKKGYHWNLPALTSLGYRQWRDFFEGRATKEETIKKWQIAERQYAKRQLTWFKKDKRIIWYDIENRDYQKEIFAKIASWYL